MQLQYRGRSYSACSTTADDSADDSAALDLHRCFRGVPYRLAPLRNRARLSQPSGTAHKFRGVTYD